MFVLVRDILICLGYWIVRAIFFGFSHLLRNLEINEHTVARAVSVSGTIFISKNNKRNSVAKFVNEKCVTKTCWGHVSVSFREM